MLYGAAAVIVTQRHRLHRRTTGTNQLGFWRLLVGEARHQLLRIWAIVRRRPLTPDTSLHREDAAKRFLPYPAWSPPTPIRAGLRPRAPPTSH